jgi:antirestriction protein ArdC
MSRPEDQTRADFYSRITNKIIEDLDRGVPPWTRPWMSGHAAGPVSRPLRHNLEPYRGINTLVLWVEALERGYAAPIWMTFRQAVSFGGHVRKDEQGATVVVASRAGKVEVRKDGSEVERVIRS